MRVRSERYPRLRVADLGLRFVDGEAEVTDPASLKRLRELAHLGVVVPDEPAKAPAKKAAAPKKSDD